LKSISILEQCTTKNIDEMSNNNNNKVKFDSPPTQTFKQSIQSFVKRMTSSESTYAAKLQNMTPLERSQSREALRSKIKWGSYSFIFFVMSGYALYSKYLGTEESRLRYNIKRYLRNEEAEVARLRLEVERLEKDKLNHVISMNNNNSIKTDS
jgi:predicted N-acyltransferase